MANSGDNHAPPETSGVWIKMLAVVKSALFKSTVQAQGTEKSISIARIVDDKLYVDLKPLQDLLTHDDIRDLPIAIISIAGAYNTGKSVILNFFLRNLLLNHDTYWMGGASHPVYEGIEWRFRGSPGTQGIQILSKVYVLQGKERKVAVILIDTEGLYDPDTKSGENPNILRLSALLSSVQIVNVKHQITADDFRLVESAFPTDAGPTYKEDGLMQDLIFLVRDWEGSTYGYKGGKKYVEDRISKTRVEINNLQTKFESPQEVKAFKICHPGEDLRRNGPETFNKHLDNQFKRLAKLLVESVLDPERVTVKRLDGDELTGASLSMLLQKYNAIFNQSSFPSSTKIVQTQEAFMTRMETMSHLVDETTKQYKQMIQKTSTQSSEGKEYQDRVYRSIVEVSGKTAIADSQDGRAQEKAFAAGAAAGLEAAMKVDGHSLMEFLARKSANATHAKYWEN